VEVAKSTMDEARRIASNIDGKTSKKLANPMCVVGGLQG
jgi:hypothetical protein